MGSIPAPNIAQWQLDEYRQASELQNQRDQLAQQQKAQQQNNAIQQGQLANQTQQQGNANQMAPLLQQQQGLENQKAQFEKQQREAILGATQAAIKRGPNGEPQGVDYDKLENEATARGALPGSTNELQKQRLALGEQAQKLSDEQAAAHLKENNRVHQVVAGIGAAGPEGSAARKQAFDAAMMAENKAGHKIDDWPTQAPSDSDIAAWDTKLGMHGQAIEDKLKESEVFKNMQGNVDMQELHSYLTAPNVPNEKLPPSQRTPASYASWKAKQSPLATFNLNNSATPTDITTAAQGLVDGSMKWGDIVANRLPLSQRLSILKAAKTLDPNYSSGDYAVEQAVKKSATSGEIGKNLTAFNTAIEHANQLKTAADALDNGDVRGLNAIGNQLGYQFGSDKTTNFNVIKNALSGEISKVFKGGEATDAEIKAVQAPFDNANSPAQLKGAIQQAIALMNSKRDALKGQVEQGLHAKPNFNPPSGAGHVIKIGNDRYQYKGSGPTEDLSNYTKL